MEDASAVSTRLGTPIVTATNRGTMLDGLEAIKKGLLTEDELTTAVERLFTKQFKLVMFDAPSVEW
jgi:hypothetical protein